MITKHSMEVRVHGRLFVVVFKWEDYGRTYESESQGANRTDPIILAINESKPASIRDRLIFQRHPDGRIYSAGASRSLLESITEAIHIWGKDSSDEELGPDPS